MTQNGFGRFRWIHSIQNLITMVNLFNCYGVLTRGRQFNDLAKSHYNLTYQTDTLMNHMRAVQVEIECFCDLYQSWFDSLNLIKFYGSGLTFHSFCKVYSINTSNLHFRDKFLKL